MHIPYKERIVLSERAFIDIDIKKIKGHYKFTIVLIKDNKRVFGFDNHEGQEPHKHVRNKICKYEWKGIDKLVDDFYEEYEKYL